MHLNLNCKISDFLQISACQQLQKLIIVNSSASQAKTPLTFKIVSCPRLTSLHFSSSTLAVVTIAACDALCIVSCSIKTNEAYVNLGN